MNKEEIANIMKKKLKSTILKIGLVLGSILLVACFVLEIFNDTAKKASQFGDKINEAYTIEGNEIKIKDEAIDQIIAGIESGKTADEYTNSLMTNATDRYSGQKNRLDSFYLCDPLPPETESNKEEIQEMKRKYIRMFLQAELVTQEVNRGGTEEAGRAYGRVYIKRTKDPTASGTETKELTFKPLDKFQQLIDSKNMDVENYFSIDESGKLLVSSWSKATVDGTEKEYTMTARTIDYKALIQQYSAPYDFLVDLCMQTQSTQFMVEFVNRILNSRIEITIQDIYTKVTTVETLNYTVQTETFTKSQTETISSTGESTYSPENPEYPDTPSVSTAPATPEVTTTVTEMKTPSAKITYAKTWFVEQRMNYTNTATTTQTEQNQDKSSNPDLADEIGEWEETVSTRSTSFPSGAVTIHRTWTKKRVSKIDKKLNINTTTTANSYSPGLAVDPISYEKEIIALLEKRYPIPGTKKYVYPGGNLKGAAEMFFMLLQSSSRTQGVEQIMRYILYKYTGKDYGVTEFDFSIFDPKTFNSAGGSSGILKEYIRYWEHSTPPPTNADGTKYIIEDDGAGHPTVGYGIDIFNGGFADLFVQSGYPTNIGGEVDKEFVDALEDKEIQECLDFIKSMTSGLDLTGYQINALVSRTYNCGPGAVSTLRGSPSLTFVESYRRYWNKATDDQFEKKDNNANYGHSLYTQYMSKPTTSDGKYLAGLERRRKSEWVLFQTGYYDVLNKWHTSASNLLEAADEVHREEITWTYSVGGTLFWNNIEMSINNPNKVTCCATFVSCALYRAGYATEEQMNSFNYNLCSTMYDYFSKAGWQVINSYDQLEPGDIVFMNYHDGGSDYDHVQLYAGNDTWYNAGSTDAIQKASPYSQGSWARQNFYVALRPEPLQ